VQWRLLNEAAASLEAVHNERVGPLVPPRRRFISRSHHARLEGCRHALRYIDARVTMRNMGAIEHVIGPESPMVVHAFVEAAEPHQRVSNAGCIRVTPSGFAEGDIEFVPPPSELCPRLVADAIDFANAAPAPAITRASWLLAAIFAIHPFVDGNGRTGRLLFHGVQSESLPAGIDWGTLPELAAHRSAYLEATRRPMRPSLPDYDARRLEPIHLMSFVAESSTEGARRSRARLRLIDDRLSRLVRSGRDHPTALVWLAVAADRNVVLDELTDVLGDAVETTEIVNRLVDEGQLTWNAAGRLQPVGADPFAA
jgi:hypothetical protein